VPQITMGCRNGHRGELGGERPGPLPLLSHDSHCPSPRTSVAAAPENPEFSGVVDGHALKVQFCLYSPMAGPQFDSYNETAIVENGCRIVLFNAFGMFPIYDSHFSSMIGAKAFLEPGANPVVIVVAVQDAGADAISYAILRTLHP
jgi:hypothetical protein